jgi:GLPGLI family protein
MGLPGLIVEAYDAKKQVVFKFDGLDNADKLEKPAAGSEARYHPKRRYGY